MMAIINRMIVIMVAHTVGTTNLQTESEVFIGCTEMGETMLHYELCSHVDRRMHVRNYSLD